ncbi:single-stranded DNA-binding protein [Glutamicibacter sp.]|uniref:single-stranded DNA-binding protein n=1 Tax=Glutamicibacter sp. TaxID=1931995 RepID=UPI002B4757EE|nr:single-stranded DNA-binding protein [Glutamicibacter sp.]HJX79487.1 single-stranded DNA-binding protein [Glutamicibacter sp.]
MSDLVTIRAVIGTEPKLSITPQGLAVLKFRAVTHERKRDAETGQWVDAGTNWYSISAFRSLAENGMESFEQGDHIVVTGKLQVRQFERNDGSRGTSVDIEAFSFGHDLKYGTSNYTKVRNGGGEFERSTHGSQSDGTEQVDDKNSNASWPERDTEAA